MPGDVQTQADAGECVGHAAIFFDKLVRGNRDPTKEPDHGEWVKQRLEVREGALWSVMECVRLVAALRPRGARSLMKRSFSGKFSASWLVPRPAAALRAV